MKIKKINLNVILIVALVIIMILYLKQCNTTSNLKDEAKISEMNQKALLDSITTYETKNGKLVYEKSILIASEKELKELNSSLYEEVQDLKKNPSIIFKEKILVQHDTVKVKTMIKNYDNGKIGFVWNYDTIFNENNFQKLFGRTIVNVDSNGLSNPVTFIDVNEIGMSFITGLTKGKDTYEIFIKSDYPGFTATSIEGAIIDKKMITNDESSFVIGPSLGYGIIFVNDKNVKHGPVVGITFTYNLNKKIKKIFRPFGL